MSRRVSSDDPLDLGNMVFDEFGPILGGAGPDPMPVVRAAEGAPWVAPGSAAHLEAWSAIAAFVESGGGTSTSVATQKAVVRIEAAFYQFVALGVAHERAAGRDATPDDLARAGYVPLAALVGPLDLLSPPTLEGALEAIEGIRQDADRWEAEYDEARAIVCTEHDRAEKAEGQLRLAREDGAAVERQMREARSAADASFVRANRAEMRAEKAGEGEPTDEELSAMWTPAVGQTYDERRRLVWRAGERAGVAHERARHGPCPLDRCLVARR